MWGVGGHPGDSQAVPTYAGDDAADDLLAERMRGWPPSHCVTEAPPPGKGKPGAQGDLEDVFCLLS